MPETDGRRGEGAAHLDATTMSRGTAIVARRTMYVASWPGSDDDG